MNNSQANTCPLCEDDNLCAVAAGEPAENCWCQATSISPAALAAIPEAARGVRCICPNCARKTKEPVHER